jgi:soluble lytic murein transglycosylase-like protein
MKNFTNYLLLLVITLCFIPSFNAYAEPSKKSAKKYAVKKVSSSKRKKRRAVFTCDQYSRKTLIRKSSRFKDTINHASRKYGVNANFIRAVIAVESCFDPRATGGLGEKGLMQLMPGTARELGVRNGYSPWQNIHGGTKYLNFLLKRYKGNKAYAAAAYNGGPGAVSKTKGPRFNQVKRYSKKVMRAYNTMGGKRSYVTATSNKKLKLSKKRYSKSKSKKYRSSKKARWKMHKVRSGQTLHAIAKKHRTSVSKLKRLNRLKSDKILAGKKLRVR